MLYFKNMLRLVKTNERTLLLKQVRCITAKPTVRPNSSYQLRNRNQQGFLSIHTKYGSATSTILRPFASSSIPSGPKTAGDIFFDNLGKLFLAAIGAIIATLVRSSMASSNQTKLRIKIEEELTPLDPAEIDDLRVANSDLDKEVFHAIIEGVEDAFGDGLHQKIDYRDFVSVVMNIMKGIKGEGFTIQFSHLLDRVIISLLEKQDKERSDAAVSLDDVNDGKLEVSFLLVALTLCLNGNVRDRVEILFDIMTRNQSQIQDHFTDANFNNDGQKLGDQDNKRSSTPKESAIVSKTQIIEMIGYLQASCQLVPDAQIVESDTKYPVQKYAVGTPVELTALGMTMKKDELTEEALQGDANTPTWTCDDFHHLLRSRAVCAWGECYVKTKNLEN